MDPFENPSYFFIPNPPSTTTDSSSSHLHLIDHLDPPLDPEPGRGDRFPQWTHEETKELLSLRAELGASFAEAKRNKPLWESISARIQHRGFVRTPDQCKSKWKNLVARYKKAGEGERFVFHEEMRSILESRAERAKEITEGESKKKTMKKKSKKKNGEGTSAGGVGEALREFGRMQMEMERRWMEEAEAREEERRWREGQWRREMLALEEETAEMERAWREKEEERRAREEARDERRHAIITAILQKVLEKPEMNTTTTTSMYLV